MGSIIVLIIGFNNIFDAVNKFFSVLYFPVKHILFPTIKLFFINALLKIVTLINLFDDITLNVK